MLIVVLINKLKSHIPKMLLFTDLVISAYQSIQETEELKLKTQCRIAEYKY